MAKDGTKATDGVSAELTRGEALGEALQEDAKRQEDPNYEEAVTTLTNIAEAAEREAEDLRNKQAQCQQAAEEWRELADAQAAKAASYRAALVKLHQQ